MRTQRRLIEFVENFFSDLDIGDTYTRVSSSNPTGMGNFYSSGRLRVKTGEKKSAPVTEKVYVEGEGILLKVGTEEKTPSETRVIPITD